jgi:hypothetical protein
VTADLAENVAEHESSGLADGSADRRAALDGLVRAGLSEDIHLLGDLLGNVIRRLAG